MNELERLISAVPRPEPGEEFDQRIHALLARQRVRSPIRRWSGTVGWLATAASVGALGFYLGRQSVVAPVPAAVTAAAPPSGAPLEVAPVSAITSVPVGADQLATLFVGPPGREGMFGKGPVTIEISPSH